MTITPKRLFFALVAVAAIFAATISVMLHNQALDARIVKVENYACKFKEADEFIKKTFPVGSDLNLFQAVMRQSGFTKETVGGLDLPIYENTGGEVSYSAWSSCDNDNAFIKDPWAVIFVAQYDSQHKILAVHAASSAGGS